MASQTVWAQRWTASDSRPRLGGCCGSELDDCKMSVLIEAARKIVRFLLGEYSAYFIYAASGDQPSIPTAAAAAAAAAARGLTVSLIDAPAIQSATDSVIREQAHYTGEGACAFACFEGDRIVSVCFYWFGERYRKRNYWPLSEDEAKLVQIISVPEMRGRGSATLLIAESLQLMIRGGFSRAYARVWHSNTPSLRAFERAGWARLALVIEINPLRRRRPFRIRIATSHSGLH